MPIGLRDDLRNTVLLNIFGEISRRRRKMKFKPLWILFVVLVLLVPAQVQAARLTNAKNGMAQGNAPDGAGVNIDFRDVDVRVVAKFISELTGKNFIFDNRVREKITVFSSTKVTPDEAYKLFETALKIHGYTTVPDGDLINVVPSLQARTMSLETRPKIPAKGEAGEDRFVTQLIRLRHADATEIQRLLQPLMDKTGLILAYQSGNTLIVTDYASNIERLLTILRNVDVPDEGLKLSMVRLKYASAKDMAGELTSVLKNTTPQAQQAAAHRLTYQVVADERTNSLIVMARAAETAVIRDLARRLDIPTSRGSDRVHVVFLKHAVADHLATVIGDLTGKSEGGQNRTGAAPTPLLLKEPVFITAEPTTNSLIIKAERQDFLVLKDIIDQLDIQRSQVLVEAIIMEMTVNRANDLGAEWRLLDQPTGSNERVAIGGTNLSVGGDGGLINQMAAQPFGGPGGLVLGAAEGTISWGGTTFINIGALVQALEQDSDVNILSTPHLLTMDNEEAKIIVGQERPFLKSSMSTATGATSPSITNTYEFKDLGLTLQITPHITQGEYIKLKIFQQLKSFISESETGAISSTKREAETTVLVRNKETVVIGGLIGNEERESRSQTPCLGDVPLLGWAFKRRAQSGDKQNLLILIKPTIIRTSEQLRAATDRKVQETKKASLTPDGQKECRKAEEICKECKKSPPVCPDGDDCRERRRCEVACKVISECPDGWDEEQKEFPYKGINILKD